MRLGILRLPAIPIHRKANVADLFSYPDAESTHALLDRAADRTAVVVGDAMLDRYLSGTVERVSPEAPVPVVKVVGERFALGGAANVAANLVGLGMTCRLITVVGDDSTGDQLRRGLDESGIPAADAVAVPGGQTTRKTRILARHQQMLRVDRESGGALDESVISEVVRRAEEALETAAVLVLQDYDKGVLDTVLTRRLLDRASSLGVPAVVDPKLHHFFDFAGAHVFKPNLRELAAALGVEKSAVVRSDLAPTMARLAVRNLLLTMGEDGMLLIGKDVDGMVRIPSLAREVYDVTGAGDTVLAVIAMSVAAEGSLETGARLATIAAGLGVSRLGAVPVRREELLSEIEENR